MQKIALSVSIILLTCAVLFVGTIIISPSSIKGIMSREYPIPVEKTITLDEFEGSNTENDLPNGSSAVILGETTKSEPTSKQSPQHRYQPPEILSTATPTPEIVTQQPQEHKTPWDGYANKEAFCKDIADRVMQQPLPHIDQSSLPPELRVSANLDAMWKDAYQSCMSQIRDY